MTSLHDSYEWLLTKRKGKNLFCDQWRSSIIGGGMAVVVGGLPSLLWWRSGEENGFDGEKRRKWIWLFGRKS